MHNYYVSIKTKKYFKEKKGFGKEDQKEDHLRDKMTY